MKLKKSALVRVALFFVVSAFAESASVSSESPRLVLTRLTERLYISEDYYYVKENSVAYVGDSYVTVIGATWTPQMARLLADEIAKITPKPIREVVDTNHDLDRVGGNAYFKSIGTRIVSIKMTRDLLKQEGERSVELTRHFFPDYPKIDIVLPDQIFASDFSLQENSILGIYLGPSHKSDDIFVYFPKEKVLYGGCVLKEQLGNTDGADLIEYPKTLRKLKQLGLDIATIVAGHYSPVHGPELIDQYLRLLAQNGH
jgi:metallo-beta-lactamase class B